jgi:hypothetical protein
MAAPIIQVRRSAVSGKIPTTADLLPGEFGINSADGKVYIEKSAGITTVLPVNPWTVGIGSTSFDMYHLNGRVAIGTDAYAGLLTIGDVDTSFVRGSLAVKTIPTTGTLGDSAIYFEEKVGNEGWYMTVDVDGDLNFNNSSSSINSVEFIDATDDVLIRKGHLGILTTNSTDALTVFGNGRITGVTTITGDCRVGVSTAAGIILTSQNGTKYRLHVTNAGVVNTVLVP